MSREDGFDVADVATGHLDDPKVKALWRSLAPDQDRMSRALMLHVATLLASWRQGQRVTVTEAVPVWLDPDAELVAALVDARLLDRTGRIPPRSWRSWYGPAADRRDKLRVKWRRDNARRAELVRGTAAVPPHPSDRPSGPSVRPARPRARDVPSNGTNEAAAVAREVVASLRLAAKP